MREKIEEERMLSKKLLKEINEQINKELYSAYLYLAMAAHFENASLPGFAHWMRKQAEEETEHAMKFFDYVVDRGGKVQLEAIEKPPTEFENPTAVAEQVLEHERFVTSRINLLYSIAVEDKDFASQSFLNWFVDEQVEEEKNVSAIVDSLKMTGEKGNSLFMLDQHLAKRED